MSRTFSYLIRSIGCFLLFWGMGISVTIENTLAGDLASQTVKDSTKFVHVPINTNSSSILWRGTEMWKSGKHEGTVNLKEGYLIYRENKITSGEFIADMNSIAITDIPKHESVPRRNLRNHLKSEDFFYVDKYPTAKFEITDTQLLENDSLRVWGNLSIRDVTRQISFTATQKANNQTKVELNTTFVIDRFEWNIAYQGSFWSRITSILDNNFVDTEIQLSVQLVANLPE